MNTLITSGSVVTFATGQTYTLKDNEVYVNDTLYKKEDLRVKLVNAHADSLDKDVKVSIVKRDGNFNLPAIADTFDNWSIDGVTQTTLALCVENLSTAIYFNGGGVSSATPTIDFKNTSNIIGEPLDGTYNQIIDLVGTGTIANPQYTAGKYDKIDGVITPASSATETIIQVTGIIPPQATAKKNSIYHLTGSVDTVAMPNGYYFTDENGIAEYRPNSIIGGAQVTDANSIYIKVPSPTTGNELANFHDVIINPIGSVYDINTLTPFNNNVAIVGDDDLDYVIVDFINVKMILIYSTQTSNWTINNFEFKTKVQLNLLPNINLAQTQLALKSFLPETEFIIKTGADIGKIFVLKSPQQDTNPDNDLTTTWYFVQKDLSNNLNFLTFVTKKTDLDRILSGATNQDDAAMKVYFDNFFNFIKIHNITNAVIPPGTYRFDEVTINSLNILNLICYGATFYYNTGFTMFNFTNCKRINIYGGHFTSLRVVYTDFAMLRFSQFSQSIRIHLTEFSNFKKYAIEAFGLAGGASTRGITVDNCLFRDSNQHNNILQTAISLGNDGEYCKIINNSFIKIPSAVRCVNGANTIINNNIVLDNRGVATDPITLQTAIFYVDTTGTNNGKIDIIGNKINHCASGIAAIVVIGSNEAAKACRIKNNDILVHGKIGFETAIFIKNAPVTDISSIKIQGFTAGGTQIVIDNCPHSNIEKIMCRKALNAIELKNNSTDVYIKRLYTELITTDTVVDVTSSITL